VPAYHAISILLQSSFSFISSIFVFEGAKVALYFHITKNFLPKHILLLWYRVVAATAPGITAKDAPDGQTQSSDRTMLDDGFLGIL
jgi:hypothetical protein